eukprot:GEMP01023698.1.p1 GENE.GEMP01023698.1~~GEMP01023698.1.p1  ORF type:complete len:633 (+),score=161.24 GEMP01023698.1:57-1955(+)
MPKASRGSFLKNVFFLESAKSAVKSGRARESSSEEKPELRSSADLLPPSVPRDAAGATPSTSSTAPAPTSFVPTNVESESAELAVGRRGSKEVVAEDARPTEAASKEARPAGFVEADARIDRTQDVGTEDERPTGAVDARSDDPKEAAAADAKRTGSVEADARSGTSKAVPAGARLAGSAELDARGDTSKAVAGDAKRTGSAELEARSDTSKEVVAGDVIPGTKSTLRGDVERVPASFVRKRERIVQDQQSCDENHEQTWRSPLKRRVARTHFSDLRKLLAEAQIWLEQAVNSLNVEHIRAANEEGRGFLCELTHQSDELPQRAASGPMLGNAEKTLERLEHEFAKAQKQRSKRDTMVANLQQKVKDLEEDRNTLKLSLRELRRMNKRTETRSDVDLERQKYEKELGVLQEKSKYLKNCILTATSKHSKNDAKEKLCRKKLAKLDAQGVDKVPHAQKATEVIEKQKRADELLKHRAQRKYDFRMKLKQLDKKNWTLNEQISVLQDKLRLKGETASRQKNSVRYYIRRETARVLQDKAQKNAASEASASTDTHVEAKPSVHVTLDVDNSFTVLCVPGDTSTAPEVVASIEYAVNGTEAELEDELPAHNEIEAHGTHNALDVASGDYGDLQVVW